MRLLKVVPQNFEKQIEEIITVIREGKIIICPTDTVYGLVCQANSKETVKRLFEIKKRSFTKPIPVFVKDIKTVKRVANITNRQERFLNKVWPGKVTVVLKAKKSFPEGIVSSENKIGIRIPNYPFLNVLLDTLKIPLTATSANISGKPASTEIRKVIGQFKNQKHQLDFVIDAGNLKSSQPSTVIDLTYSEPKILRAGAIEKEKLVKILKWS